MSFRAMLLLLTLALVSACTGKLHPRSQPEAVADEPHAYVELSDAYAAMQGSVSDSRGWVELSRCDALLWASLRAAAGVAVEWRFLRRHRPRNR